jgi:hypothetical protein
MKWESDICEVNGSKVAKLGSKEEGHKRSSIHVVGGISYMDTTMADITFLISQGRHNQELMSREME